MIRARSRWNSVRKGCWASGYFGPRESPDFWATGARIFRSSASICSRVFQPERSEAAVSFARPGSGCWLALGRGLTIVARTRSDEWHRQNKQEQEDAAVRRTRALRGAE